MTRSWAFYESSHVTGQVDVTSKRTVDIMDTVLLNTYRYLRRRTQYLQCFYFVFLIALLVGVLSGQKDVVQAYVLREAVMTSLFPEDQFGESVLTETNTKVASTNSIFDWIEHVFLESDDAVFKDPQCGDGVCTAPFEYPGWSTFGCVPDCGEWDETTTVRIKLEVDNSVPVHELEDIRWNLFCTDLEIFGLELQLFEEDMVGFHMDIFRGFCV